MTTQNATAEHAFAGFQPIDPDYVTQIASTIGGDGDRLLPVIEFTAEHRGAVVFALADRPAGLWLSRPLPRGLRHADEFAILGNIKLLMFIKGSDLDIVISGFS